MKNGNKRHGVISTDIGKKDRKILERLARESGLTVSALVRLSVRPLVSGKVKVSELLAPPSA